MDWTLWAGFLMFITKALTQYQLCVYLSFIEGHIFSPQKSRHCEGSVLLFLTLPLPIPPISISSQTARTKTDGRSLKYAILRNCCSLKSSMRLRRFIV
jgi:hypothetical protein